MILTSLDDDGKLTLPKKVLDALGIKPGDEVGFYEEGGQMVIFRNPPDDEIDEELGMTYGEVRAMLAEAEEGEPIPAEQAFAEIREHIRKVARSSNAA